MNPFASTASQPLRVALIDVVPPDQALAASSCPDTGPHAVEMLARALARRGHAVDIYRARASGEPVWEDLQSGVRIHRIAPSVPWPVNDQAQLSQAVQGFVAGMRHMARDAYPCDVVHAFGLHAGLVGLRLTKGVAVPFILSLKPCGDGDPARAAIEELLVRKADGLIAFNERNREDLFRMHAASRSMVHLVPRGVDHQFFRPGHKAALRRSLGWPDDALIVMWGGSADADVSRVREALPVFRAASRLSAHMVVLGAESPWPAETAGIPGVTVVDLEEAHGLDRRARLSACYAACDLLVLPPWHGEGDDINAKEAMACGAPVLVLSERSSDEASRSVEDGVTGYVLHRPRPEAVLQRMRVLCEQPGRRAAMGMAAVLRMRTFYTWQKVAARFVGVYTSTQPGDRLAQDRRAFTLIRNGRPRLVGTRAPMAPAGA